MNKTEALKRLDALETEAAALRQIIEAPEKVEKKPLVQAKVEFGYPVFWANGEYEAITDDRGSRNAFETRQQAEAYAEAFNTLLDLRRQPGTEPAEDGNSQFTINANGNIDRWSSYHKVVLICPMFDSEASALAAREAVGLDRILRMYNTLHGRGYE